MATNITYEYFSKYIIPWSEVMDEDENHYREQGGVNTVGTVFTMLPQTEQLVSAFNENHKNTKLSVGARALCKHYVRKREGHDKHPFWKLPRGSETEKSIMAMEHLQDMLDTAVWKNLYMLNNTVKVYEIRNSAGYGMRWQVCDKIVFRGYLEPQQEC